MSRLLLRYIYLMTLLSSVVLANTEKAIFLGPPAVDIPPIHSISSSRSSSNSDNGNNILDNLHVHVLTPDNHALRTHLEAQFPSNPFHHGKPTWLILDELTEGQRYEVRVCWAATQPTAFKVNTFELQTVLETPELLSELSGFSSAQLQLNKAHDEIQEPGSAKPSGAALRSGRKASLLFLQILAAADYYTMNNTLMQHVPPVHVDIILDPFILNLLPRSLVPTVAYIIAVSLVSWFTAQRISTCIRHVAVEPTQEKKDQ
ncbi:hypothetical protein F4810DRAFT_706023 [Camillea tinctor]|nr:hypothetical protein F4810DRAFT_706023 [Camillea tinctor]